MTSLMTVETLTGSFSWPMGFHFSIRAPEIILSYYFWHAGGLVRHWTGERVVAFIELVPNRGSSALVHVV